MHRAGWLRALLVYSRGTGGWAMEYETSPWALTAQGEALIKFAETAVTPGYGLSIGSHGTAEGQFGKPWAVASDASGNLWAADNNSPQRIERFSPTGSVELAFGSTGIGNGQFSVPEGLAISPVNGKLYVADSGNSRVQEFTASGTFERLFGGPGSSAGKFTSLHGMAIDSSGSVWVAAGGERIERFSATGTFEKEFTISGASIMDLAVRGTTLYATDATHNKVLKIDTGTGLVTGEIGSSGKGEGQMSNPIGIDVDPLTGAVFVADSGNYRVDVFGSDGRALGSFGGLGSNPGQFNLIRDVAVDAADRSVYVSDGNNSRVQKWWIDP
jgi:DNA-binding beta-propeller fold protein YncE